MIKFRIDVDYPCPSRIKSFIYTAFGIKTSKDYLKNPKIIANLIIAIIATFLYIPLVPIITSTLNISEYMILYTPSPLSDPLNDYQ